MLSSTNFVSDGIGVVKPLHPEDDKILCNRETCSKHINYPNVY